jgi:hypothetical protein
MSIIHKFQEHDFGNGFQTHNSILDSTPYEPEVLILGTFNPNTQGNHNLANFFYGRDNYLFPMLHGIFNLQTIYNQSPPYENIIWPICNKLKLSFADLITSIFPEENIQLISGTNDVIYNEKRYNLLKDNHLIELDNLHNQIVWNDINIINYINNKPSLKYVYLTQKSSNKFLEKYNNIVESTSRENLSFRRLYTPTGQSLSGVPRELFLAFQWLIEQSDTSGINLSLLHQHNINNFIYENYRLEF